MPAFLVSGATGHQGGAVARELLKAGAKVHALVRDPTKLASRELEALGATVFVGDFSDVEVITKAAAGVKGIFVSLQVNRIVTFLTFTLDKSVARLHKHRWRSANSSKLRHCCLCVRHSRYARPLDLVPRCVSPAVACCKPGVSLQSICG